MRSAGADEPGEARQGTGQQRLMKYCCAGADGTWGNCVHAKVAHVWKLSPEARVRSIQAAAGLGEEEARACEIGCEGVLLVRPGGQFCNLIGC
jgi:hypothetical protein